MLPWEGTSKTMANPDGRYWGAVTKSCLFLKRAGSQQLKKDVIYHEAGVGRGLHSTEREKEIENMKKIVATNEKNAHALNFLGYTYAEIGVNLEEAKTLVKRALELRPDDGYILDSLA